MKIQLEQPAVNISKLMGGKKLDGGFTLKTLVTYMFCLQETLKGNQNN